MRVCVVGAGSIGGFLAVKFALSGEHVLIVTRPGPHRDVIVSQGLKLVLKDGTAQVAPPSSDGDPASGLVVCDSLGSLPDPPPDVLLVAVKANQLEPIIEDLVKLLKRNSKMMVVPLQNGIPFWYFHKHGHLGTQFEGRSLKTVDPNGRLFSLIPADCLIGNVVYPACDRMGPGCVQHIEGDRFPLGELDGQTTDRIQALSAMFVKAGLKAPILDNIRSEIWLKLWGNMVFNPISSLTHATLVEIAQHPECGELCKQVMTEAQTVASKLNISFRVPMERRLAGAASVGAHKTSTLQDVEAGRPPEIEALLGSVLELGEVVGVPMPHSSTLYALTRMLSHVIQTHHVCVRTVPFVASSGEK